MKTVLITGGGRGIGRATALLCAARGWSVGINYRSDRSAAEETAEGVREAGGAAALLQGDMADAGAVAEMFTACESALGVPDGVVINAGIVAPSMPLAEMEPERIRLIFEVNALGAYYCAREAARRLSRGGAIVMVSSMAAKLGAPFEYVDYAGAKAAMDALTIGLSKELGPQGIRVNAVRPGLIDTEIHASGGRPGRAQDLGASSPLGRAGRAEEVAEAIVWLLSDAASYATGTFIDVAGGR